jgi:pilus assembly protein Flp/PilA
MFSFSSNKKHEKGQGLVEYAIILALVAIVVVSVMRILGPKVGCTFSGINNSLPGGSGSSSSNCGGSNSDGGQDFGFFGGVWWNSKNGATPETIAAEYCSTYSGYSEFKKGYNLYSKTSDDGSTDYHVSGTPDGAGYVFLGTGTCP